MNQLKLIIRVITSPKEAFLLLPTDKFLALAWLAPLYFGMARAIESKTYEKMVGAFENNVIAFIIFLGFCLIMIPLGASVTHLIARVFKKRLSLKKLMNIYGYSLSPRIFTAMFSYILLLAYPSAFQSHEPKWPLLAVMIAGIVGSLYSAILYIYGVVVCPSEK